MRKLRIEPAKNRVHKDKRSIADPSVAPGSARQMLSASSFLPRESRLRQHDLQRVDDILYVFGRGQAEVTDTEDLAGQGPLSAGQNDIVLGHQGFGKPYSHTIFAADEDSHVEDSRLRRRLRKASRSVCFHY